MTQQTQDSERERYAKYLCSKEWWTKRNAVIKRSNSYCEKCHKPAVHVHHLTYIRKYDERLEDLIALCVKCHEEIHGVECDEEQEQRKTLASLESIASLSPYEGFLRSEAKERYRSKAKAAGMLDEFEDVLSSVTESLLVMESRANGIVDVLREKAKLIKLYRTLDRLGF